jgi:hypothetical protein
MDDWVLATFNIPSITSELGTEDEFIGGWFWSNRWNIESCKDPIIHISSNLISDHCRGIATVLVTDGEWCIFSNLGENLKHSWISLFDIIFNSSVIRIDPRVTARVEISHEFNLIMFSFEPVFDVLSLFFRESELTPIAFTTCVRAFIDGASTIVCSVSCTPVKHSFRFAPRPF